MFGKQRLGYPTTGQAFFPFQTRLSSSDRKTTFEDIFYFAYFQSNASTLCLSIRDQYGIITGFIRIDPVLIP
jgi:hypothetical protein